ncbi:MAG: peptide/nickel transport system ATP-binding protein [Cognaticolwellia sp.]|jgi:peptide/nickel transport system ATP-binding protein
MTALELQDLRVHYGGGWLQGPEHQAVRGVSLTLGFGETVGLIGESGSGKTSLVLAALGLVPSHGRVRLLGQDLRDQSRAQLRRLRAKAQIVFQDPASMLNPGWSIREHLHESATLHQSDREAAHIVGKVARQVGLELRLEALPGELSGGEQRRAGVARVLLADPKLIIADEPTAGLDAALRADLIDLLLAAQSPQRALVIVSHDLALIRYACQRVWVMLEGEIVESVAVSDLGRIEHHPYTTRLLASAGSPLQETP